MASAGSIAGSIMRCQSMSIEYSIGIEHALAEAAVQVSDMCAYDSIGTKRSFGCLRIYNV